MKSAILFTILSTVLCITMVGQGAPLGTAFTYQGHLYDANQAANNIYDLQFKLYDASITGTQKGSSVNKPEVDVIDGYFTVGLDFGASVFDGNAVWLEIGVRPGNLSDPNVYTILSPRQLIAPAPYAMYASKAKSFNVPADVSGSTTASNAVIKATNTGAGYGLYGYSLSNYGIYGYSSAVPAIYGYSASAEGIYGTNGAYGNYGYLGGNNYGVYGYAYTGTGGYFASSSGYGLLVASGSVGIGTTLPAEELHVKGSGFLQGIFESTNSSGGIKLIANNAQAYELQSLNDGGFTIYDRTDSRYCMKIDTAGKTEFTGDIHAKGNITKAFTSGTSNPAIPIAYAYIYADGTVGSGTPNVSCTYDALSARYDISIAGENYVTPNYVTVVTPAGGPGGTARSAETHAGVVNNKLSIILRKPNDSPTPSDFSFVMYKP